MVNCSRRIGFRHMPGYYASLPRRTTPANIPALMLSSPSLQGQSFQFSQVHVTPGAKRLAVARRHAGYHGASAWRQLPRLFCLYVNAAASRRHWSAVANCCQLAGASRLVKAFGWLPHVNTFRLTPS